MNNIYYIFKILRPSVLYWLFPLLLVLAISLIYSLYFNVPYLCDDNGYSTLFNLKYRLTAEVAVFRQSVINHECYSDMYEQLTNYLPSGFRDIPREQWLDNQIQSWQLRMNESLNRARQIEASIKAIEPNFNSPLANNNINNINSHITFWRVGRGS